MREGVLISTRSFKKDLPEETTFELDLEGQSENRKGASEVLC